MEPTDLVRLVECLLGPLQIPYYITGSMATIAYGEPRLTTDIDVVIDLPMERVDDFLRGFPEEDYYWSRDAVVQAIRRRFQFNIIHPEAGLKIDFMLPGDTEFDRARMGRAARVHYSEGETAWFTSAEDIIVMKLRFYREGKSDKHLRDIASVLRVRGDRVDRAYVERWVAHFGLHAEWKLALDRLSPPA